MLNMLRRLLERFWVWLGGELPAIEAVASVEPGPGQFVYVVQPGDTLSGIARRFSTSVWILADLNNLDDPSLIRVGQQLLIPRVGVPSPTPIPTPPPEPAPEEPVEPEPGPFIYIVQSGDTLSSIARRFGVTVTAIVETNRIQDANLIRAGQRLLIPSSEPQPQPEPQPEPEPSPVPSPEPEPSPPPVEPAPTPPVDSYVYVVQPVDTLLSIARRFNVTLRAIIEANDIENPNMIRAGQRLIIPGASWLPTPAPTPSPEPDPVPTPTPTPTPQPPPAPLPAIPWPEEARRGIYVSYFAIGHEARRRHVIDLLTMTEIDTLVIDAKGDHGLISYPTGVAMAHDIGAARPTARDFGELMDLFKANGIYTIARIVTFKDNPLAEAYPERAAKRQGGGIWHDREGLGWSDPFVHAAWEYNADLAEEAANLGFDEIQFDYVRFPTGSQEGEPFFSQPVSREARVAAISGFLSYVRGRLAPLGVAMAADVFGYTCWRKDDTLIGQDIERMAQYLDVLCPMLYPSTFGSGIPGYKDAISYPYEIVYESVRRAVSRVAPLGCQVRPWIQDFPDYRFDGRTYGAAEIRDQMQGSFDGGGKGYMAWDPRVKYTTGAYLAQKAIDMSLLDDYN